VIVKVNSEFSFLTQLLTYIIKYMRKNKNEQPDEEIRGVRSG